MGNEVQSASKSVSVILAERYHVDPAQLVTMLIGTALKVKQGDPPATQAEIGAFMAVCCEYDLNPFLGEIYGFRTKSGSIQPVVGIDGWVKVVQSRKGKYGGHVTTICMQDKEGTEVELEQNIETGTVNIKRTGDKPVNWPTAKPVWAQTSFYRPDLEKWSVGEIQFYHECKRNTGPWNEMPARLIGHKSFIQGARKGYGISGIMDQDEAERIRAVDAEVVDTQMGDVPRLPAEQGAFGQGDEDAPPTEAAGTIDMPATPEQGAAPTPSETHEDAPGSTQESSDESPAESGDRAAAPEAAPVADESEVSSFFEDELTPEPEAPAAPAGPMSKSQQGKIHALAQKITKAHHAADPKATPFKKPQIEAMLVKNFKIEKQLKDLDEVEADDLIEHLGLLADAAQAEAGAS